MKKLIEKIKDTLSILHSSKGFTLLELLVVVLIIGILAAIALPQYKMAVTKAKVASILPLMRRFKDALQEYKLQHGDYVDEDDERPDADTLGVNWPNDWKNGNNACGYSIECSNDYWTNCMAGEFTLGDVRCLHNFNNNDYFLIMMYSNEEDFGNTRGITTCESKGTEGEKVCKALGGKLLEDGDSWYGADNVYKLN